MLLKGGHFSFPLLFSNCHQNSNVLSTYIRKAKTIRRSTSKKHEEICLAELNTSQNIRKLLLLLFSMKSDYIVQCGLEDLGLVDPLCSLSKREHRYLP